MNTDIQIKLKAQTLGKDVEQFLLDAITSDTQGICWDKDGNPTHILDVLAAKIGYRLLQGKDVNLTIKTNDTSYEIINHLDEQNVTQTYYI